MNLTFVNAGTEYLDRTAANRERAFLTSVALGGGVNYTLSPGALGFLAAPLVVVPVDSFSLVGDTATYTVTLDSTIAVTFGEVALLTDSGVYAAMYIAPSTTVKSLGSTMVLTMVVTRTGLATRLTYKSPGLSLSQTRVDYDSALLQLKGAAHEKDNFSGLIPNETGATLLELLAGIVDFDSSMIESAYQETLPDLAKLEISQYAIQTMLRTRLIRKRPASIIATLTRSTTITGFTIPPYTEFLCNGTTLFNRDALLFAVGVGSLPVVLYEGKVKRISTPGKSTDYQFYVSDEKDFQVSDQDVLVTVDATVVPVVTDPLWNYPNQNAVQDFTNKFGALTLFFGNELIATRPRLTETVYVTYVVTQGEDANSPDFLDATISCADFPTVVGVSNTGLTGGGNPPSITFYQRIGGDSFGGKKGAVTPSQYVAKAREYPGVLDAMVKGQRDLAPLDYRWFNTAKVILLTSGPWSSQNKADFLAWYQQRTMYSMRYVLLVGESGTEPKKKMVDISLQIFCKPEANLTAVQSTVYGAVRALFAPRAGVLGRDVHPTDITETAMAAGQGVIDYLEMTSPTSVVVCDLQPPPTLSLTVTVGGGGTLAPGNYMYGVTAVDIDGETQPVTQIIAVSTPGSRITLNWTASPGASSYKVYGRTEGSLQTLLSTSALSFDDIGVNVPALPAVPSINSSGVHYAAINTLNISVAYSKRRGLV